MRSRLSWSKQRLAEYQNRRLRHIVSYAYNNVPFYREKLKKAGVDPRSIRTVKDTERLPITTKDEIRSNLARLVSRDFEISKLQTHRTSGSTGQPLYFYLSRAEDEYRKARHLRANVVCGQKIRDRYLTITHPLYFSQTTRIQRLLGFYSPIPVSVFDDVDKQIATIEKLKPSIIDGYASSILLLARRTRETGVRGIKPRFLISGADLIGSFSRRYVEEVFGAPFYDQYACSELERIAWQCLEKAGYHIDADTIIAELVDADGERVAAGETGEMVCTSLFNYSMPFIRYEIGDLGQFSDDSCPCGMAFPLMKIIEGRKDDTIILPDGRIVSAFAFIAIMYQLSFYKYMEKFRIIQKTKDLFSFQIKINRSAVNEKIAERELTNLLAKAFGISEEEVKIDVEFVDSFSLNGGGKFETVTSEVSRKNCPENLQTRTII